MAHLTDKVEALYVDGPRLEVGLRSDLEHGGAGFDFQRELPDQWAWMNVFTPEECDSIINIGKRNVLKVAQTYGKKDTRRKSNVCFLKPSDETYWIFERLAGAAIDINKNHFQFELSGFSEGLQFTEYVAPVGKYGWHADNSPNQVIRKLTLVAQLSDPNDYDGGLLQINPAGNEETPDLSRGQVVAFPSHVLHQVTPVTAGSRYSLVVWATGPRFK